MGERSAQMSQAAEAPQTEEKAKAGFILSDFLPYRIVSLGHLIGRRLSDAYAAENITIPEWRVLAVVSQADQMAARDVVALTPMDKMAVSRAAASLEEKGLVERRPDGRDKRVVLLALTGDGRALFERIARLALDYEARLIAVLTPEERRAFKALLERLEWGAKVGC